MIDSDFHGGFSRRVHVRGVHFDADGLTDQIHREDQARVRPLPQQPADDTLQRTVHHFHHHAFADQRTRIELQLAFHEPADPVDLEVGNRRDLAVERRRC